MEQGAWSREQVGSGEWGAAGLRQAFRERETIEDDCSTLANGHKHRSLGQRVLGPVLDS
jgi:hypothetical protein